MKTKRVWFYLNFIDNLITTASAKHAQVCAKHLRSLRQARLQLLRDGDVSAWARKMRPAQPASSSYSPDWVTTPDRRKVRPTTTAQVLLGAQQDWNRLLQEPSCSWAHPVVLPFRPTHHCLTPRITWRTPASHLAHGSYPHCHRMP